MVLVHGFGVHGVFIFCYGAECSVGDFVASRVEVSPAWQKSLTGAAGASRAATGCQAASSRACSSASNARIRLRRRRNRDFSPPRVNPETEGSEAAEDFIEGEFCFISQVKEDSLLGRQLGDYSLEALQPIPQEDRAAFGGFVNHVEVVRQRHEPCDMLGLLPPDVDQFGRKDKVQVTSKGTASIRPEAQHGLAERLVYGGFHIDLPTPSTSSNGQGPRTMLTKKCGKLLFLRRCKAGRGGRRYCMRAADVGRIRRFSGGSGYGPAADATRLSFGCAPRPQCWMPDRPELFLLAALSLFLHVN